MEENLMNYKIIADYAYEEMERLGKQPGAIEEYKKSIGAWKIAHAMFLQKMNEFCQNNFSSEKSIPTFNR